MHSFVMITHITSIMKKLVVFIIVIATTLPLLACDICGCGAGNSYIGILPDFTSHIFGIRYRYNTLRTHIGADGMATYLTATERYHTAEAWAGWNLSSRLRLMATIPYSFDERVHQGVTQSKNGLGDISLSGYYEVLHAKKTTAHALLVQTLWVGAGIKLPTGRYNPVDKLNSNEAANLFQLGTGSTDFTVNAMYDLRRQDAGINLTGAYKINSTNKEGYSYGNKYNLSMQLYYKFRVKEKMTIAPNAGVMYENAAKDIDNRFEADISGGHLLMGTIGAELAFKHFAVGANWQRPLQQQLANGIIKAGNRAMLHVSWLL